jgi:sec-independent protein translocase protein TatB
MFGNIGWGEMLVLVVVGLVVLGPERLPGAIRWTSNALRQTRDYLSGATSQLRDDLGPEFDDLRKPLSELQKLRGMTPRAALTKHLLDGDDSWLTGAFDPPDRTPGAGQPANSPPSLEKPHSAPMPVPPQSPKTGPLAPGAPAPFDADAT